MSKYTNVKDTFSESQRKKFKTALENSADKVTIHLNYDDMLGGEDILALTNRQLNSMVKRIEIRLE